MSKVRSKHLTQLGYVNGEGKFVPTRMTLQYYLDGDDIVYRYSCCSHHEKQYVKKIGNEIAEKSEWQTAPFRFSSPHYPKTAFIVMEILIDIFVEHKQFLPRHHQRFFENIMKAGALSIDNLHDLFALYHS